jgi:hypothetical protein
LLVPANPAFDCAGASGGFSNCSFEVGGFSGWNVDDANAYFPAEVDSSVGYSPWMGIFGTQPSAGTWSARIFTDVMSDGYVGVSQDVVVPAGASTLRFDYRCGVNLLTNLTESLRFEVQVQPGGGGAPTQTTVVWTGPPIALENSDAVLGQGVDLSAYAGQAVRVAFVVWSPDPGQGMLELDDIGFE